MEAIGGAVTVAKVTDPPADGALNGSPQREVPMNDLEIIREKKILSEEQIREVLDPVKLTNLDKAKYTPK